MAEPVLRPLRSWALGDRGAAGAFFQEMNIYAFSNNLSAGGA